MGNKSAMNGRKRIDLLQSMVVIDQDTYYWYAFMCFAKMFQIK